MTELSKLSQAIIEIAKGAGQIILDIYNSDFDVEFKDDASPLTIADEKANAYIVEHLKALFPHANLITEETKNADFDTRQAWEEVWIVDPLDGTKEFVKRNGEFTVNIALLRQGEPVLGVIYVPVTDVVYFAEKGSGAFKIEEGETTSISVKRKADSLVVVGSRSHTSEQVQEYVNERKADYNSVEFIAAGSSLKFCLVAEGKADVYPRFGPTMEWDIAAGCVIAEEAGATVTRVDTGERMMFNKENLLNPYFIVSAH